ncbi:btb poz fold [Fusarium sporotrichioides]|uniref:Btb poz fold n=1 Tax=Fusarium sporotrichioides TaxID=5514 RepID=A0A395S0G1_FUSSP|nr:btb poz fold [Fusarium sporotrichioides]
MSSTKNADENPDKMPESRTLELAPDWDTLLIIPDKNNKKPTLRCMVSSSVLAKQLSFSRALNEGLAVQNGKKLEITLLDNDPDAMGVILSILHGNIDPRDDKLSLPEIVSVARHYDKYCCYGITSAWTDLWLNRLATRATAREVGSYIAAVYYFKCPNVVKKFAYKAVLYADEFNVGKAWTEEGINIGSDIKVDEIKDMLLGTQCGSTFYLAGPEYLLILEAQKVWPFAPLGSISDVWDKLEAAAIQHPQYARAMRDLRDRIRDLATKAQSNSGLQLQSA